MKLSRISLAILPLLSLCSVQAAVYNVVEIGEVAETALTYAAAINDNGDTVFNGAIRVNASSSITGNSQTVFQYYKFPIRLDAIDFENESVQALFTDEQLVDLQNGDVDADTLAILLQQNPSRQPIGFSLAYIKPNAETATSITLRDTELSRTSTDYLYDINNSGISVGLSTAPYSWQEFTPEATEQTPEPETKEYWVPELSHQLGMAVVDGQAIRLLPPYQSYGGGYSVANAVNDNGLVAGFGSVNLIDEAAANVESSCTGASEPINLCYYNYHISGFRTPGINNQELVGFGYTQRGLLWQLNGTEVSEPTVLGFLGDKNSQAEHNKEGFKAINYYSKANDVNLAGIVVGVSLYTDSDNEISSNQIYRAEHATLFSGGDAIPMVDVEDWLRSSAGAINNNNIAIGVGYKSINGGTRSKMFYFDYNTNQSVNVDGFFTSSNTVANAINDSDQVVGRGEVIIGGTTTRRNHGFIYDIGNGTFSDLNHLIACDSPYTIVEAKDINNDGIIAATALVKKEQRDLLGEPVLDEGGNPVMSEVAVVVKLEPIANGEAESCSTEQTEYEREGGSVGFGSLLIGLLLWWRRRV